jgi:hypothetical protein
MKEIEHYIAEQFFSIMIKFKKKKIKTQVDLLSK